jgi:hypothetical protein
MVSSQDPFNEKSWVHLSEQNCGKRVGKAMLAIKLQRARFSVARAMAERAFFRSLADEL